MYESYFQSSLLSQKQLCEQGGQDPRHAENLSQQRTPFHRLDGHCCPTVPMGQGEGTVEGKDN